MATQPTIALIAAPGLDNGLIFALIAHNLVRNGFNVTLYHDSLHTLNDWLPDINIQSYPSSTQALKALIAQYDTIISDYYTPFSKDLGILYLGTLRFPEGFSQDLNTYLSRIAEDKKQVFEPIILGCGLLRKSIDSNDCMVNQTTYFLENNWQLKDVVSRLDFKIPSKLQFQKFHNRVVIHPLSQDGHKNWPPEQYVKLATQLKTEGYTVEFLIPDTTDAKLKPILDSDFLIAKAKTLPEIAAYLYQSRAMIDNASGFGHLASALGVPVVTVYRKKQEDFRWRPGFGPNVLACPVVSWTLKGEQYWKPFLSVRRVYETFQAFMQSGTRHH